MGALVLVMVIGLSVDYVVHLADAYLEAPAEDRLERCKFMLVKMGLAVVNGGVTTIGAAGFMCVCYITFFEKFGIVILVTVFQSVITALFFFSAVMALFGPQGTSGNISLRLVLGKHRASKIHKHSTVRHRQVKIRSRIIHKDCMKMAENT